MACHIGGKFKSGWNQSKNIDFQNNSPFKGIQYIQAFATDIDFKSKGVKCTDVYEHYENNVKQARNVFELPYDKLVLAVGTKRSDLRSLKV